MQNSISNNFFSSFSFTLVDFSLPVLSFGSVSQEQLLNSKQVPQLKLLFKKKKNQNWKKLKESRNILERWKTGLKKI